nr:zf-CCHC domain-containing protein/UBN2 domain-containing protein [Tanacetum cinerariifolium]
MSFDPFLPLFVQVKRDDCRIVETKKSMMPRLPLDVCSPLFGAPRDRSYEIIATKQSEKYKCKNIFPTSSNIAIHANGEEDVVIGEVVAVNSSSLEMLTKNCLGGMMCFARFNTISTSLKALDEGYSSKNYVRKFLSVLHPKLRANVTAIGESKELTSLSLDKLIENLKVHEMIIKKDSKIVKEKVERKSLTLKARKESSDAECSTSRTEHEEYAMVVRDFKKFFKRRGRSVRQPRNDKKTGSWSDSDEEDDEKVNNETCLVAQASSGVCSESSYFSDENSSIDD